MRTIAIESDTLSTGWTVVTARIPPRVCGAPNTAATDRLKQVIASVDPSAFDPVPEAVAVAVQRDVPLEAKPPNCDGCHATVNVPRANFPPFTTFRDSIPKDTPTVPRDSVWQFAEDDRDDDEGEAIHGYPPGVACNVTGECE